tara:strand:- start:576 stop:761 length:186 start_codon:yes stop_codon:yes gene_type:complete
MGKSRKKYERKQKKRNKGLEKNEKQFLKGKIRRAIKRKDYAKLSFLINRYKEKYGDISKKW